MHYKNGRPAKNGDHVVHIPPSGVPVAGILYDAVAGNDYCNGKIAIPCPCDRVPNLIECLHADDVAAATVADSSSITAPPGMCEASPSQVDVPVKTD